MCFPKLLRFSVLFRRLVNLAVLTAVTALSLTALGASPVRAAQASPPPCVLTTPVSLQVTLFQPVISDDASTLLYAANSDIPNYGMAPKYFVTNRLTRKTLPASLSYDGKNLPNDDSYFTRPAISDNGRLVVFFHSPQGMVPEYNGPMYQLYARDMLLNKLEIVSKNTAGVVSNGGSWNPAVSTDGRYVAFETDAYNLVPEVTQSYTNVYVRDRKLQTLELVSVATDGTTGTYSDEYGYASLDISGDGRYVAFTSSNLKGDDGVVHSGVYLRDRQAKRTYWIANGFSPAMTPDARYIVFESGEKLLPADQSTGDDLYLYDRTTSKIELLTAGPNGVSEGSGTIYYNYSDITFDGSQVAFASTNPNLVNGDTNNTWDIFIRDRTQGVTTRLSVNDQGQQGNAPSENPSISADGRYVVFFSTATNLVSNAQSYLYLCQRTAPLPIPPSGEGANIFLPLTLR